MECFLLLSPVGQAAAGIYFRLRSIAALSSGEPIQYPYLAAASKICWISSRVGGLAG